MDPRRLVAIAGLLLVTTGAVACSSDSSTTSGTTGTTAGSASATCADLQRVQDDVDALRGTDVVSGGTNALRTNLDQLSGAVSDLADSASGDLKTEADALRSSVDQLSSIVDGAKDQPVTSTVSQVSQQLQTIGSDLSTLLDSARENLSDCDTADTTGVTGGTGGS